MSSNRASAALSEAHTSLIREVSRSAGLRGVDSPASSDTKRDASAFLTTEFPAAFERRALSLQFLINGISNHRLPEPQTYKSLTGNQAMITADGRFFP